jgi:hypothetical protein
MKYTIMIIHYDSSNYKIKFLNLSRNKKHSENA